MAESAQFVVSLMLAGLIWVVQLVHYPSFAFIEADRFQEFHRHHSASISCLVIPLMLGELALAVLAFPGMPAIACVAVAWLSTFLVQVPLHHRLSRGKNLPAIRRLVATNWVRTAAWTGKAFLLMPALAGR